MEKVIFCAAIILYGMGSYWLGAKIEHRQTVRRCLTIKASTYTEADMEYILFGESQE